ncbi:neurogenic locus notch homolog protein 1-like [Branchiostoma lanceolatum]|uniref:neurogenic locus notch homolog protein 1-like n=1 Tax=Branchiostoma lanceolatum TaxID=7740 RepID=UPI003457355A
MVSHRPNRSHIKLLKSTQQTAKMWALLLLIGAANALPASVERYLATVDGTDFYKVRVPGNMINYNVRAACENIGMRVMCHETGYGTCNDHWASPCVKLDVPDIISCRTLGVLSQSLCGTNQPQHCQPLDDIFLRYPENRYTDIDDGALGVDFETSQLDIDGKNYANKYTLCAVHQQYLVTYEGWMFYKVRADGQMTDTEVRYTCGYAGMSYPCWYTGHGTCDSSLYYSSSCISFDHADITCRTTEILSYHLCGTTDASDCLVLNGTVVYHARSESGAVIYGESGLVSGESYYDLYALCAVAECIASPCVHGRCAQYSSSLAVCWCDDGWTGDYCDRLTESCANNPCLSGGTCQDALNSYTCTCPPQTTGRNCGIVLHGDTCYWFSDDSMTNPDASTVCHNKGGHLVNIQETAQQQMLVSSLNHVHDVSFWIANVAGGSVPSWMYHDCVLLDSSMNYMGTDHSCLEQHNYICESDALQCQPDLCQNGGICTSCFSDSIVHCDCPQGFTGTYCETVNPCDPNPCPFDWDCIVHIGAAHCTVPTRMKTGLSGFCTESSCGPGRTCMEDGPAGYFCISG